MESFIQSLLDQILHWAPQLIIAILVFLAFWLAAKVVDRIIHKIRTKEKIDPHVLSLTCPDSICSHRDLWDRNGIRYTRYQYLRSGGWSGINRLRTGICIEGYNFQFAGWCTYPDLPSL